jgi:hypothetical protein
MITGRAAYDAWKVVALSWWTAAAGKLGFKVKVRMMLRV